MSLVLRSFLPRLCGASASPATAGTSLQSGGIWSMFSVRTVIRDQFPRAREGKRVKVHGWNTRMKTSEGRRILMRRILKGRHVLSH